VAARAAQRLSERDGRPKRVPREPRPGEDEEIPAEQVGMEVDPMPGGTPAPDGTPVPDTTPPGAVAPDPGTADRPAPG
jgi:hypothetical protein